MKGKHPMCYTITLATISSFFTCIILFNFLGPIVWVAVLTLFVFNKKTKTEQSDLPGDTQ